MGLNIKMSDIAIRVENLSKQYRIGARQAAYKTLRESLTDVLAAPFHRLRRHSRSAIRNPQPDFIWALKHVSFEVKRGEVDGAGKFANPKSSDRAGEHLPCLPTGRLNGAIPSTCPWSFGTCPGPFVLGPKDQGRQVQGPGTKGSGQAWG